MRTRSVRAGKRTRWVGAAFVVGAVLLSGTLIRTTRAEPAPAKQSVLGPGLYVFQTRTRESTCGDAEPDGYVLSYVAAIDGVPGAIQMSMQLVNTKYFSTWNLTISKDKVIGDARMGSAPDAPDSHFEVAYDGTRFKGTGFRTYNGKLDGKPQRCRVSYDALLRRIDI